MDIPDDGVDWLWMLDAYYQVELWKQLRKAAKGTGQDPLPPAGLEAFTSTTAFVKHHFPTMGEPT